jgi:hypothetical protein
LNPRHPAPKAGALANCATPRYRHTIIADARKFDKYAGQEEYHWLSKSLHRISRGMVKIEASVEKVMILVASPASCS